MSLQVQAESGSAGHCSEPVRITWEMLGRFRQTAEHIGMAAMLITEVDARRYVCTVSWDTTLRGPDGAPLVVRQPWDILPGTQGPPFRETAPVSYNEQ